MQRDVQWLQSREKKKSTNQKHFFVSYTTDDQLPVGAGALAFRVVYSGAHRYLQRNSQIFPNDLIAASPLARYQPCATREHASSSSKIHEDRSCAAFAYSWSSMKNNNLELAQRRTDAVKIVASASENPDGYIGWDRTCNREE
jgi:hypothetical protein